MICGRYYEYATDRKLKTKMNMYIPRADLYQKLFSRSEAE